jgi:hypothetical protein
MPLRLSLFFNIMDLLYFKLNIVYVPSPLKRETLTLSEKIE